MSYFIRSPRTQALLLSALIGGCTDPVDVVGVEEVVSETRQKDPLEDDAIADKKPVFDPMRTVVEELDGCQVTLNKSASVTRLTVQSSGELDAAVRDRVFRSRTAAIEALAGAATLPTTEVVNGALKPFNDGLYAAVELAAEHGDKSLVNKHQLLVELLAELMRRATEGQAAERAPSLAAARQIAASLLLSGHSDTVPPTLVEDAQQIADSFERASVYSKPIGFYTWSPELSTIFKRDRLLQARVGQGHSFEPSFAALAALGLVAGQPGAVSQSYRRTLDLLEGITDPFFDASPFDLAPYVPDASALGDLASIERDFSAARPTEYPDAPRCNPSAAAFPASESAENRMMRKLLCGGELRAGETLIDGLVRTIQSGALDLAPRADSGFYDWQLHALQTLLVPNQASESQHLLLTRAYKEKLVETFKSLLIQTRETHVKQVAMVDSTASSAYVEPRAYRVYPKLVVEPLPTFYLRTARAYRFLEGVLQSVLGPDFLRGTARLLEDGNRASAVLAEELQQKQLLLYGLHLLSADSIGMAAELLEDEATAFPPRASREAARAWLTTVSHDPDVARDPRVILPVAFETDPDSRVDYAIYWAVVGIKVIRLHASFPKSHRPVVVNAEPGCVQEGWATFEPYLLVEQTVQARRRLDLPPLTREEFRALCDRHATPAAIVEAVESAP